jgi:hypothetical protein
MAEVQNEISLAAQQPIRIIHHRFVSHGPTTAHHITATIGGNA